jgi:NAD(P)H-quinone oxidoreductase subunit I
MGAISEYFSAIGRTVATIGDGLAVTGSYFLRKPMTLQYPDRTLKAMPDHLPARMRGMLEVDLDLCTGCMLCEKTCPIACIKIEVGKDKVRLINSFEIEMSRCMHCGLCSECCPTEAIRHTREFEGGTFNPDLLRVNFVELALPIAKPVKKGEPEPEKLPVGSVLRRLMPDPSGQRNTRQIEASKRVIEKIEKRVVEERAKAAAAAAKAAEEAKAKAAAAAAAAPAAPAATPAAPTGGKPGSEG